MRIGKKRLLELEKNHDGIHPYTSNFDFYCIAHGSDYEPKYLKEWGDICHSSWGEGYCSDGCNICSVPCPIEGCNDPERWDSDTWEYIK